VLPFKKVLIGYDRFVHCLSVCCILAHHLKTERHRKTTVSINITTAEVTVPIYTPVGQKFSAGVRNRVTCSVVTSQVDQVYNMSALGQLFTFYLCNYEHRCTVIIPVTNPG